MSFFDLELAAPISPFENTQGPAGAVLRGVAVEQWGIDSNGNAYYDPAGVAESDVAILSLDATGDLVLTALGDAQSGAEDDLTGVRVSGRRFTGQPREMVQRAYQHDPAGHLFAAEAKVQERAYTHDEHGRLFTAAAAQSADRSYQRRADGHLFPHAPVHATPIREEEE